MTPTTYTMADLEKARAVLEAVHQRFDNYSGNNPDRYQSQMNAARREVRHIESALKAAGVIPLSAQEQLEQELDRLHPDAPSKTIVEHNGKRYQRWYYPAEKSNSGKTVHEWDKGWRGVQ